MINLSLDELRLIAQIRNISDYEKKSKEDLIKALSKTKPKPEPKPEIRVNKRKLKKLREGFDELRHKFSKKKWIGTEKLFIMLKTTKICLYQK